MAVMFIRNSVRMKTMLMQSNHNSEPAKAKAISLKSVIT